jgi:ankyrin repeat protein
MKPYCFKSEWVRGGLLAVGLCLLLLLTVRLASAQTLDVNATMLAANLRGDFKAVQTLLDEGADSNARDHRGRTAFMVTLRTRRGLAAEQFWEQQKIDLNAHDKNGMNLLMYAANAGEPGVVTFQLDHGADVNARDRQGRPALILTAMWSNDDVKTSEDSYVEAAERLLAHGANVNAQDRTGRTALTYAVEWQHPQLLQMLLRHGADVNLRDQSGCTALALAASREGDNETVRALRQHDAHVGLIESIILKDHDAVQRLLVVTLDFTECGPGGETALMLAAEEGDLALVRVLLAKGADPNARRYDGMTALMLAFARREKYGWSGGKSTVVTAEDAVRLPIVDALIKAGARVNARDQQRWTPLVWALKVSTPAVVRHLLDAGANVNAADRKGKTPLMILLAPVAMRSMGPGVFYSRPWSVEKELAELLLAHGAAINAQDHQGNTILHQFAHEAFLDVAQLNLILELGADINRRNRNGQTALMICGYAYDDWEQMKVKVIQRLLDRGANVFARDRFGNTALTYTALGEIDYKQVAAMLHSKGLKEGLMDAVLLRDAPTVRDRLAAGANPNVKMDNEETALMFAADHGDVEIARTLLAYGADVKARCFDRTALTGAAFSGDTEMMRLLLAHGADANVRDNMGFSVLLMAVRGNASDSLDRSDAETAQEKPSRLEIVQALLAHRARVDAGSENGVTPLLMAAALGNTEIVRALLAHGANPNLADLEGHTPLMLALDRNHSDIVVLLKQAGAQY